MRYRRLGRTGLSISEIALGTMNFGSVADRAESFRIMDAAHDSGVNFFDTGIIFPTGPPSSTTRPATGEGTSTEALSVITSHSVWSSATRSPGATFHSTTSTSAMPSPMSGISTVWMLMRPP